MLAGVVSFDAETPSRIEVRKKLSETVKAKEDLVMISSISTDYRQRAAKIVAYVYKTKEAVDKFASSTTKTRHERKAKGADASEAAAAPAAEAKKEEAPKSEEKK